ncbi:glycosyl hydrolase family 71-domain-containing protein [Aspergillus bertholletiae]|uniref:Glycosyl hydrolase family 71-domain-containing protein n=1 Tax=Aspergillus bertholletiae TaxID=1226010 RepID=A0A5N7B3W8_9EURO|nr:glycosyl hydrolase family 71-domain-containing protein [Aspergillus bertholletiae]
MLGLLVKAALVGLALASHSHHRHIHRRNSSAHAHTAYTDLNVSGHMLNTTTALNGTQPSSSEVDEAHIDAFALNFAASITELTPFIAAMSAAHSTGFKVFFSFDYAGAGPFEKSLVTGLIMAFGRSPGYYNYQGRPFVSTFEGPGNAKDWEDIKKETGCLFVPSWSSLGAKAALELGTADGLFSWAGWPWGNKDIDTYVDASYLDYLDQDGKKPYMMPVSPWLYTNLPGYNKNWLWRGDSLWTDRWEQVMAIQPTWLEIISWSDYGESHYIGPLHDIDKYRAFKVGKAPFNYARGMPHDGWRLFLPYWIDTYKWGEGTITKEGVVGWMGGTTGNTASQLQLEFQPTEVAQDKIFFAALLTDTATVSVTVGGVSIPATWENVPDGGIGGEVKISISRSDSTIAEFTDPAITTTCTDGYNNFNAWVGSASAPTPGNFQGLCEFTCQYGYCPIGACQCTKMGAPKEKPKPTGVKGYPIAGEGSSYIGPCDFACNYGYCPPGACGATECTATGALNQPPPANTTFTAVYLGNGDDSGFCTFACQRGYCPDICASAEGEIPSCTDDDDSPDLTFSSWDALEKASGNIRSACMPMYATQGLMDILDTALANYTDVDNGYDEKFGYYAKYLRSMVPGAISNFMSTTKGEGPGNEYFQCRWATPGKDKGDWQSCPIRTISEQVYIEYKLLEEEKFFKELQSKYGISKDWVELGTYVAKGPQCPPWTGMGPPLVCNPPHYQYEIFPMAKEGFTIPNPKDSIKDALPRFQKLQVDLAATWGDLSFFLWDGDDDDAVTSMSMPVFMLLQTVDSMATVKEIGEEKKEREEVGRRNLILLILSAVLILLPFAAEVVGAVTGVAWIADAATLADISANIAMAGYDIVKDPKSAPMELLSILFAGSGRTAKNFSRAADVRRGMDVDKMAKFGSIFKENDSALQGLLRFCKA